METENISFNRFAATQTALVHGSQRNECITQLNQYASKNRLVFIEKSLVVSTASQTRYPNRFPKIGWFCDRNKQPIGLKSGKRFSVVMLKNRLVSQNETIFGNRLWNAIGSGRWCWNDLAWTSWNRFIIIMVTDCNWLLLLVTVWCNIQWHNGGIFCNHL